MTVDNVEATPNENAGADAIAFASALLGVGDITDEEEEYPNKNLLAAIAAPEEVITAGAVAAEGPKEKAAADKEEVLSHFSSTPLFQETDTVTLFMAEGED